MGWNRRRQPPRRPVCMGLLPALRALLAAARLGCNTGLSVTRLPQARLLQGCHTAAVCHRAVATRQSDVCHCPRTCSAPLIASTTPLVSPLMIRFMRCWRCYFGVIFVLFWCHCSRQGERAVQVQGSV